MFVARSLMSKQSPETRSHSWFFLRGGIRNRKPSDSDNDSFFNCEFKDSEGMIMKTNPASLTARVTIGTLFLITGIVLVVLALSTTRSRSATPGSGTITGPTGSPLAWDGTATPGTPPAANGESSCVEGVNCDTFTLTVGGTQADWATAGKRIEVKTLATGVASGADDYDLVIHKTSNSGPIV